MSALWVLVGLVLFIAGFGSVGLGSERRALGGSNGLRYMHVGIILLVLAALCWRAA